MAKAIHGTRNTKYDLNNPDLTTLHGRLKFARLTVGITTRELSKRSGCFYTALNRLENGVAHVSCYVVHIAEALGVNAHWLVLGVGEMWLDREISPEVSEGAYNLKSQIKKSKKELREEAEAAEEQDAK